MRASGVLTAQHIVTHAQQCAQRRHHLCDATDSTLGTRSGQHQSLWLSSKSVSFTQTAQLIRMPHNKPREKFLLGSERRGAVEWYWMMWCEGNAKVGLINYTNLWITFYYNFLKRIKRDRKFGYKRRENNFFIIVYTCQFRRWVFE